MKLWIARNGDGLLYLHLEEPYLINWINDWDSDKDFMRLEDNDFQEVTFENSPMEVELVIKK